MYFKTYVVGYVNEIKVEKYRHKLRSQTVSRMSNSFIVTPW
jgi:hypothetical protein